MTSSGLTHHSPEKLACCGLHFTTKRLHAAVADTREDAVPKATSYASHFSSGEAVIAMHAVAPRSDNASANLRHVPGSLCMA